MKTLNTKKKTFRGQSYEHHRSYGIQNWLVKKQFIIKNGSKHLVDGQMYKDLLFEFTKKITGNKFKSVRSMENFVQNNFNLFCKFCGHKYKNN